MAAQIPKRDLLYLYRQLLRSAEVYPSKNRARIYQSIRDDFKENKTLDPTSERAKKQIFLAQQGLGQLRQFDGRVGSTNFSVTLEQNPFPKPDHLDDSKSIKGALEDKEDKK